MFPKQRLSLRRRFGGVSCSFVNNASWHANQPPGLPASKLFRLPACRRVPIAPWALSLAQLENLSDRAQNA